MPVSGGPSSSMLPPDIIPEGSPWHEFPAHVPPERRLVLWRVMAQRSGQPDVYAVGYARRYGDGTPYAVVPGFPATFVALAWADVLPDGVPMWSIRTGDR